MSASATSRSASDWNNSRATTIPRSWSDPLTTKAQFVPGRNDGIMAFNWTENQRATWAIGTFTNQTGYDQPPTFVYDHWGLDMTMRATYLPWYDEASGGRGLLHLGVDYAYRSAPTIWASSPLTRSATSPLRSSI